MAKIKSLKSNKTKKIEPFDVGWDAEQAMADSILAGLEKIEAAFRGLTERMLRFWKKDFLFEMVGEIAADHEDQQPYVCEDCQETHGVKSISDEERSKMN